MKNKFFSAVLLILVAALLLSSVACGNSGNGGGTEADTTAQTEPTDTDADTGTAAEDTTDAEETTAQEMIIPEDVPLNDIYPIPVSCEKTKGAALLPLAVGDGSPYLETLTRLGLAADGKSGIPLTVELADLSSEFETGADEGYILTVTASGVSVRAQTERGAHYALVTLGQLISDGSFLPLVTVKDAPVVPVRGVIEGFYGTAWTKEFRLELMERMGDMKMNAYIYAPKDDLKHRSQWRELYVKREINELTALVNAAKANSVRFIYAISPGNDINLGGGYKTDFRTLTKKCQQLYDIGVRDFAILLDDIPVLDAAGHAKLLNDFNNEFVKAHEGCSQMIAITPEYTDPFLTKYTDEIAPLLDKDIMMMWTGPGVVYPKITNKSLERINGIYGSKVFIWWNYPVNDVQVEHLYLDACRGFDTDINTSISGLVSNPMNQGEASLIPLFTTSDFLWNPSSYDPERSLSAAVNIIDPELHDELLLFADAVGASPMNNWTSTAILRDLLKKHKFDKYDEELNAQLTEAAERLATVGKIKGSTNTAFVAETLPWIEKTEAYANMALAFFKMERANSLGATDEVVRQIGEFAKWQAAIPAQNVLVSQDVLDLFIAKLPEKVNRFVGLAAAEGVGDYSASTSLATYQSYTVDKIIDGDPKTYFWSAGGPAVGDYVQIDLGTLSKITAISLDNGASAHPNDCMTEAVLRVSADGKKWTDIDTFGQGTQVLNGLDIQARYVRMVAMKAGTNWITMSEFTVTSTPIIDERISTSDEFVSDLELARVCDGSALTVMTVTSPGSTLSFDTTGMSNLRVIAPEVGEGTVCELIKGGAVVSSVALEYDTVVDCLGADTLIIRFGSGNVGIAEIIG